MSNLKNIFTIEAIKEAMRKYGYYASEELQYNAFLGLLNFSSGQKNRGQDIFAVCLEGPPGAGKTEYAKTYTKLIRELWNGDVELIDYQCDATTGKTELFEDINISAAIRGDADNVNIPGKLVEAIKKVNDGKKVVLFIDEYDKAREETDAFLLQFLQSGKINSTQHGDLEIKEKYKSNLQLILCKNDFRETLSGPLSRRIRIIRLDYMLPDTFFTVAKRQLIEDKPKNQQIDEGIINLVSLMYSHAYDVKDLFTRLPSCSEMLIAIQDADNLIKYANAPKYIVYRTIIECMFKEKDDINTFESGVNNIGSNSTETPSLKDLINEMKKPENIMNADESLNDLIARTVFKDETRKMQDAIKKAEEEAQRKIDEATTFLEEYEKKFSDLETRRKKAIETELKKVGIGNETFISELVVPGIVTNFNDETAYIKRGKNIFDVSHEDWVQVASATKVKSSSKNLTQEFINSATETGVVIYENGFLISENKDFELIMVREENNNGNEERVVFFANTFVIPANVIKDICNALNFIVNATDGKGISFTIDCLAYNETPISSFEQIEDNVYKVNYFYSGSDNHPYEAVKRVSDEVAWHTKDSNPNNIDKIIEISRNTLDKSNTSKQKVLTRK